MTNPYQAPQAEDLNPEINYSEDELKASPTLINFSHAFTLPFKSFPLFGFAAGMWVVAMLIFFVWSVVLSFIPLAGSFLVALITPLFMAGIYTMAHNCVKQDDVRFSDLFIGFNKRTIDLLLLGVFSSVGGVILFAIAGGVLFIFGVDGVNVLSAYLDQDFEPLLELFNSEQFTFAAKVAFAVYIILAIPMSAAAFFAPILLIQHSEVSLIGALKYSLVGVLKNIFTLIFMLPVLLIISLGCMLALVLPFLFVAIPVMMITGYTLYRQIFLANP